MKWIIAQMERQGARTYDGGCGGRDHHRFGSNLLRRRDQAITQCFKDCSQENTGLRKLSMNLWKEHHSHFHTLCPNSVMTYTSSTH